MRSLPLAAEHERLGASFAELAGWRVAAHYGNPADEQRAVRTAAGVIDWTPRGKIRVTGEDRLSFLDGLLTNDLKPLREGQGLYAAVLDHKARVHGDLVVYHAGDHYLLETDAESKDRITAYLTKLLVSDDVTLTDATSEFAILAVVGPRSGSVVNSVFRDSPPKESYDHRVVDWNGSNVRIARSPYFGGDGYELWIPATADMAAAFRTLLAAGATAFGTTAAEALRIEAGRPKFGVDMGEDTLVLEAGLEHAISMTKGCYVGQEIVSRAVYQGHLNRRLVLLEVGGKVPPKAGSPVLAEGQAVGSVTSAAWSANRDRVLAFAYVRRPHDAPATGLTVRADRDLPARVSVLPFVP